MNIIITPVGSAGDVHPFVGLGLELQRRGHHVTLAVCGYFEDLVRRVGLEYVEFGTKDEFLAATNHPDLWSPTRAFSHIFHTGIARGMRQQYELIEQLATPGDTVVIGSCLGFGARIAQEKLGVPLITVHIQPVVMWSAYESPVLPKMIVSNEIAPRWLRRLQYWIGETFFIDRAACPQTNAFRRELGLPPMKKTTRWWHSPQCVIGLFPAWYGPVQPDWPPNVHLTHFPLWDEREVTEIPREVDEFLAAGDPPIVFTPGSAMRFGTSFFQAAVDACRQLKRRGILVSRFTEHIPADLPDTIRHFDYVPFSVLLPQVAAIVHHGGIGTTAQGLAAGIPHLIMPMAHDQPDNAARLKRFGVGDWLLPAKFHGPAVSAKLQPLLNSTDVHQACAQVASRFAGRNGIEEASDVIEQIFP